jgi:putative phage-type endonuclease
MQDIVQGSPEWFAARAGRVTASKISTVMAKGKAGAMSATRKTYMGELLAERFTGKCVEGFKSGPMDHGNTTEPQARAQYTMRTGRMVKEVGFIPHPSGLFAGASPDGLVGDDGMLEIKCPNTMTHIDTLDGAGIARPYLLQMHWQMICAGRKWVDFISYDPRLPEHRAFHMRRVPADTRLSAEITSEVRAFITELDALEARMNLMPTAH